MSSSYEWWTINIAVQFRYRQFRSTFFKTARAFERGTPKRTKAAWPEKATTENATCDENMFLLFGRKMNNIVLENVEMVCERATWRNWRNSEATLKNTASPSNYLALPPSPSDPRGVQYTHFTAEVTSPLRTARHSFASSSSFSSFFFWLLRSGNSRNWRGLRDS